MTKQTSDTIYNLHVLIGQAVGTYMQYADMLQKNADTEVFGGLVSQFSALKLCQVVDEIRRLKQDTSDRKLNQLLTALEPVTNELEGYYDRLALGRDLATVSTNRTADGQFVWAWKELQGKAVRFEELKYLVTLAQEVGGWLWEYYKPVLDSYYEIEEQEAAKLREELSYWPTGAKELMLEHLKAVIMEARQREEYLKG